MRERFELSPNLGGWVQERVFCNSGMRAGTSMICRAVSRERYLGRLRLSSSRRKGDSKQGDKSHKNA